MSTTMKVWNLVHWMAGVSVPDDPPNDVIGWMMRGANFDECCAKIEVTW